MAVLAVIIHYPNLLGFDASTLECLYPFVEHATGGTGSDNLK